MVVKRIVTIVVMLFLMTSAATLAAATVLKPQVAPVVYEGTTLVPFRVISDWAGAKVTFDAATKTIKATGLGHTISLTLGAKSAVVDGKSKAIEVPALSLKGQTMVPLRFFADALGINVSYDTKARVITLKVQNKQASLAVPPTSAATVAEVRTALGGGSVSAAAATKKGGTYTVGVFEEPKTNNLVAALGTDATTWTFAPLLPQYNALYGNAAPRLDFAPALAAGDPSPFKKEGEFYTSIVPVRKDILWSDGVKLTSADVVFTYMTILKIGPDKLSGNWESAVDKTILEKVEAIDDYTVKFYLKSRPGLSQWQYNLLQVYILSKKHWEPVFAKAFASQDPVKTIYAYDDPNPVTINGLVGARWEKGAFFELKRDSKSTFPQENLLFHKDGVEIKNDVTKFSYKSKDMAGAVVDTVNLGPSVDTAVYRLYLNQNAAYLALQKGEVDYVLNPSGMQKGTLDLLKGNANVQIINNPQNGFRYLGFNCDRYPMNIKAFRQAIATVTDRDWLATNVLQGVIQPVASVVPPGNGYWYNPNIKIWGQGLDEYDRVREAVKLLKAAGFSWEKEPQVVKARGGYAVEEGEGLRGPDGKLVPRLNLLAPTAGYDPLRYTFALHLEGWIRALGIDVKAKPTDFNVIVDKQNNRDYDMTIAGWGLGLYPDHMKDFFHSESSWNRVNYKNATFDKVVEDFVASDDMAEAKKLAFKAQEILAEDVPYVVLFVNPMQEAYRSDKIEYEFTSILDGLQGLYGIPSSVAVLD